MIITARQRLSYISDRVIAVAHTPDNGACSVEKVAPPSIFRDQNSLAIKGFRKYVSRFLYIGVMSHNTTILYITLTLNQEKTHILSIIYDAVKLTYI